MSALTANRDSRRQEGELISVPGSSGYTYYAGALLTVGVTDGIFKPYTATQGATTHRFAGVACDKLDLASGGSTGELRVYITGIYDFAASSTPATTAMYQPVYAIDDQTVGTSSASCLPIGMVVGVTTGHYEVKIDQYIGSGPVGHGAGLNVTGASAALMVWNGNNLVPLMAGASGTVLQSQPSLAEKFDWAANS